MGDIVVIVVVALGVDDRVEGKRGGVETCRGRTMLVFELELDFALFVGGGMELAQPMCVSTARQLQLYLSRGHYLSPGATLPLQNCCGTLTLCFAINFFLHQNSAFKKHDLHYTKIIYHLCQYKVYYCM